MKQATPKPIHITTLIRLPVEIVDSVEHVRADIRRATGATLTKTDIMRETIRVVMASGIDFTDCDTPDKFASRVRASLGRRK